MEALNKNSDAELVVKDDSAQENDVNTTLEDEKQVKYELDTVKNIKKAKANLIRGTKIT